MLYQAIGRRGPRGALLLIVLTALTFFMMIGTLMLVTATRTRATARAFGSAANRAATGMTEASAALDEALMVLLRGRTVDDESFLPQEMRGQSILEDKFGTDSLSGSAVLDQTKGPTVVRPLTLNGPLKGTQGMFEADLVFPTGTSSLSRACDLNGRILTLSPSPGEGEAVSFRVLRATKSQTGYTVFLSRPPASSLSLGLPRASCPVIISGREYVDEANDAFDTDPWLTRYVLKNSHVDSVPRPAFATQAGATPVVDNDNDGVADGIWLSGSAGTAVIPSRPSPLGGTLTFDVSYLVLDLDSRVNMNAHGALTPLLTGSADWPTTFQSVSLSAVPTGMGYGTADIAASRLVATGTYSDGVPGFPGRWANICQTGSTVVQQASTSDQRRPTPRLGTVDGRYGPSLVPGQWTPGIPGATIAPFDQTTIGGMVTLTGSTRPIGNSVTDLHVRMKAFVSQHPSGPPSLFFFTPDRSANDFVEPPYLLRLDGDGSRGLQLRQSAKQPKPMVSDDAFSLAELERMLRQYDADAGNLPPRLAVLLDDFTERSRMTITTDSWDTPVISGTAMNLVRDYMRQFAEPTSPSSAVGGQGTAVVYDVMSPDVAAGLQFDLNRPLDHPSVPPSLLASIKETYCRHLYSLLVALGQPANQATAQWVANVCDFRDPDSTLTRFRYDTNPADGWNVADSTEVFGCERPEVVITETIAWDDKLSIVLLHPWDAKLVDNQTVDDQTQFDLTEAIDPALGLVSATAAKRNVVDLGRRVGGGANGDSIWRIRIAGGRTVDLAGLNSGTSLQVDTSQYLCLATASSGTMRTVASGSLQPPRQATPPTADNGQVFLERLANPSVPLDNSSSSANYNPYIVVDKAPLLIGSGTIDPPKKMRRRVSEPARFWNDDAPDQSYTAWQQVTSNTPATYPDPVNWYHWPNRPFISATELALVPGGDGSRPAPSGQGPATPALDPASRLFEAVRVPSRFAGLAARIGDDAMLLQTGTMEGVLITSVPAWREPGRVNLNTVVSNTGNISVSSSGTTSLPLLDDAVWRATVGPAADSFTNPFATQSLSTAGGASSSASSFTQMLALGQPGGKLYQDTTQPPRDRNDFFAYATAMRLANVGTIRSNVFAVWITVRITDSSPTAGDPIYRRMFAIIDRSMPVGFLKGNDLDARNAIRLQRYLD